MLTHKDPHCSISKMTFSIIAAIGKNNEIGIENHLPWTDIPEDKRHFRTITSGHTVIMGRKTFESIGMALPGRNNIIVTKNNNYAAPSGCDVVHSLGEALLKTAGESETFIIGGAEIYDQAMPFIEKIYLTVIDHEFKADTFFPKVDLSEWRLVSSRSGHRKEGEPISYSFVEYVRI